MAATQPMDVLGEEPTVRTVEGIAAAVDTIRRGVAAVLNSQQQRTEERLATFKRELQTQVADVAGERVLEFDRKLQAALNPLRDQLSEVRGGQVELSGLVRQLLGGGAGVGRAVPVRTPYAPHRRWWWPW